ncbi:MAG: IS66 family transposase [Xanthomonadales bacterium]|nr:IS66 family transposase [Xanthomonadales bacterium]
MDAAQIATITDIEVLRAVLLNQVALNAQNEAQIAQRDQALAERDALIAKREKTIHQRDIQIEALTYEVARLRRLQFSARSERMDAEQRSLFDETIAADLAAAEAQLDALKRESQPASTPKQTPRRQPLPAELPRVTTVHEPDCNGCTQCGGELVKVGEHIRERLACQPIEFFVRREVFPQYACRPCERIVAEPVPPAILDRSQADPSLLAQVTIAKYLDHLPLYRQEGIYARSGVELSRSTLAEWIGTVGVALQPLVDAMRGELLNCPVLHADETPVAQLDPSAGKTKRAYLFAYRSAVGPRIVVFDYCPSRSGEHARRFLGDWHGALMVDDYVGYKASFDSGAQIELGCWAHARRKFVDLHKASKSPIAAEAIERIGQLYRIEREAAQLDPDERTHWRQAHARPLLEALHTWLQVLHLQVLGNSGTAKAIAYCLKRWPALARYAEDGRYPIDNNPIENAIRPVALGRKNWLFAGSETAGRRAAAIMSLLATAKANQLDPHAWLNDVLNRLPTTKDRDIGMLLPYSWNSATG